MLETRARHATSARARRNLVSARERGKCRSRARSVSMRACRAVRDDPRRATHLLAWCAIRYCVRFHTFLYSRKLIVIRASSTGPRAPVNEARTPRVLRGFSPHRVADDDIITGCCERMARRGGLPRLPDAPRVGDILVGSRRADPHPLHRVDRARASRRDRVVSVTARTLRASCPRRDGDLAHDARLDYMAHRRDRGKEFADRRIGRLTAELRRGERLRPLQHGRRHVGWRRIDVTDSP